jgi:cytochrome bd ubiquinol oxidase subunit II
MIESLSSSMGLAASDPSFWMPLALAGLIALFLLGLLLLDGVALGAGLLLAFINSDQRIALIIALRPWQSGNAIWLIALLGSSMAAFPFAWSAMSQNLYLPFMLLISGAMVRHLAAIGVDGPYATKWVGFYGAGSLLGAIGFGLLIAEYVTGQRFHWSLWSFILLLSLSMLATFVLLAASWMFSRRMQLATTRIARIAALSARWSAAGMVGLSFLLALANPAVFYRWTHGDNLLVAAIWWLVMLVGFVWLDWQLRRLGKGIVTRARLLPILLVWLLISLCLAGIVYSIFPFFILDDLSLWDAALPIEPLDWVARLFALALVCFLPSQIWCYRRFLSCEKHSGP